MFVAHVTNAMLALIILMLVEARLSADLSPQHRELPPYVLFLVLVFGMNSAFLTCFLHRSAIQAEALSQMEKGVLSKSSMIHLHTQSV